ncbi:MAG: hypothetical protein ACQEQM_08620 [Thermoplasmatota archaeon]
MTGTWVEETAKILKKTDRPLHYKKEIMPKATGLGATLDIEDWWEYLDEGKISQELRERLNKAIDEDDGRYDYVDIPYISEDAQIEEDKIDSDQDRCWKIIDDEEYRLYIPKNKEEIRLENLDKVGFVHNTLEPEKSIKREMPEKVEKVSSKEYKWEDDQIRSNCE